jgi:hypothetical protein
MSEVLFSSLRGPPAMATMFMVVIARGSRCSAVSDHRGYLNCTHGSKAGRFSNGRRTGLKCLRSSPNLRLDAPGWSGGAGRTVQIAR